MVDLHTHVLANIDDGASSYEESVSMLKVMCQNGVKYTVATPHFDFSSQNSEEFIEKRNISLEKTKELLKEYDIDVKLLSGCELMFTPQLANENLDQFTIENTDYVLVELSTRYDDPTVLQTFDSLLANGFIPILAHVERYSYLISNSERLVEMINKGVLIQVNTKSLNSKKYPFIKAMFKHNLVHLIGSDCHNMSNRYPDLRKGLAPDYVYSNMQMVIENSVITVNKPSKLIRLLGKYI